MVVEALKDFVFHSHQKFGTLGNVGVIIQFIWMAIIGGAVGIIRKSEHTRFSCFVGNTTRTYHQQVKDECFLIYDHANNNPLHFHIFAPLSTGLSLSISIIYAVVVHKRVEEIASNIARISQNHENNQETFRIFYSYFVHLVLRALVGTIFIGLQYTSFYPNEFDHDFECNTILANSYDRITHDCKSGTASEKRFWGRMVCAIHSIVVLVIISELIYVSWQRFHKTRFTCDEKFVMFYFLGKKHGTENETENEEANTQDSNGIQTPNDGNAILNGMDEGPSTSNQTFLAAKGKTDSAPDECRLLLTEPSEPNDSIDQDSSSDNVDAIAENGSKDCSQNTKNKGYHSQNKENERISTIIVIPNIQDFSSQKTQLGIPVRTLTIGDCRTNKNDNTSDSNREICSDTVNKNNNILDSEL